jgi:fructose-1,6-bisphosphatase I
MWTNLRGVGENRAYLIDGWAPGRVLTATRVARRPPRSGTEDQGLAQLQSLERHLNDWADHDPRRMDVAQVVQAIASTAATVSVLIGRGPLAGAMGAVVGDNADGDAQKELDVRADEMFTTALKGTPVAVYGSEECETPLVLHEGAPLAVAIDPLDGSSNIDTNVSVGTIFSILPMPPAGGAPEAPFLQPGSAQLAAGFVIYGPQTSLVLTVLSGTHIYTYDRETATFYLTRPDVQIPIGTREFAINASNYNHWDEAMRAYIDDCLAGIDNPNRKGFNMRWIASLVAEAFRIFARGGIFLYPRDKRAGYQKGRLRLVYEASPIALLAEQAGGAATDGEHRILDLVPQQFHERVPLVFGARDKVERVVRYHTGHHAIGERQPLFARRGLFRT